MNVHTSGQLFSDVFQTGYGMEDKQNLVFLCDQVFTKQRNKYKRATFWREQGLIVAFFPF